jgi:uncharacterized membrane protein
MASEDVEQGRSGGPSPVRDDAATDAGMSEQTRRVMDEARRRIEARPRRGAGRALNSFSPRRQAFSAAIINGANGAGEFLRRHWLAVVNGILGTYVGLAVLTPIGYMVGFTGPSSAIFRSYRFVCDQIPSHSFFLGGYQMCICTRCLAIYTTMLLMGLTLAFLRKRTLVRGITWWVWVLLALPMALDGGTQLFGLRESNVWLRLLTGTLFGLGTALFTLPQIQAAASDEPRVVRR